MTTECHYSTCPRHSRGEGPFCYEDGCKATPKELKLYAAGYKLQQRGYNLEELDRDNPYVNIDSLTQT